MTAPVAPALTVLTLVVALQLVAETALTPYFPQLFRELFEVTDLSATGAYLTVCRIAALIALPLWGVACRRWPLSRLLVAGLLASAAFDLGLALAPDLRLFTAMSAGAVATGSSLVLAYPALVALLDGARGGPGHGGRTSALVTYAAVFHGAAVLATAVGAGILLLPQPRWGLAAFAVADVTLAVLVWRHVPSHVPAHVPAAEAPAGSAPPQRSRLPLTPFVAVIVVAVLLDLGTTVPRPFFVELVLSGGGSLASSAVLFLLPSLAALAVLPAAGLLAARIGEPLLPVAAGVSAAGLALQAALPWSLPGLAAGRFMLGLGLGLLTVALDMRVFAAVGTQGPGFTVVETARSAALLTAPMLATVTAGVALSLPLAAGAVLLTGGALIAVTTSRHRPARSPALILGGSPCPQPFPATTTPLTTGGPRAARSSPRRSPSGATRRC